MADIPQEMTLREKILEIPMAKRITIFLVVYYFMFIFTLSIGFIACAASGSSWDAITIRRFVIAWGYVITMVLMGVGLHRWGIFMRPAIDETHSGHMAILLFLGTILAAQGFVFVGEGVSTLAMYNSFQTVNGVSVTNTFYQPERSQINFVDGTFLMEYALGRKGIWNDIHVFYCTVPVVGPEWTGQTNISLIKTWYTAISTSSEPIDFNATFNLGVFPQVAYKYGQADHMQLYLDNIAVTQLQSPDLNISQSQMTVLLPKAETSARWTDYNSRYDKMFLASWLWITLVQGVSIGLSCYIQNRNAMRGQTTD